MSNLAEDLTPKVEQVRKQCGVVLNALQNGKLPISSVSDDVLAKLIVFCNACYRNGTPIVPDDYYDHTLIAELARRNPNHELLNRVEPEPEDAFGGKTVPLPVRMLSTDKAYTLDAIEKWVNRVIKEAAEIGVKEGDLVFKVTAKLDGFAAYDDGRTLYTRGDGRKGTDITRVFDRGLQTQFGVRVRGPGEIVVDSDYFKEFLSGDFDNSRNFISSVIKEGEWTDSIKKAINKGRIVFYPFSELKKWTGNYKLLIKEFDYIKSEVTKIGFDTDGIVIECINKEVKEHMGHTNHHHRWQIAFKENMEYHDILVTGVMPQTSKTGRITPVVELVPTKISGVTVSRVTGHHYGNLIANGICRGATVRVCRSGQVIPHIDKVIKPAMSVHIPNKCPSCGSPTRMDGDNLLCTNTVNCPAKIERTLEFFFHTLGNCDGFGPKVIEKLVSKGFDTVYKIYRISLNDLMMTCAFGEKTSRNLLDELGRSVREPIEDWRFLAAFGINNIGKGGCERLLKRHRLLDIFDLTVADFTQIDGFGEKSADVLHSALNAIRPDFDRLYNLGFNLIQTPLTSKFKPSVAATDIYSPIAGKTLVFTGTTKSGSREHMKKEAKLLGANVADSVSSRTDYLVCGDNVGAKKTNDAKKHGVTILTEEQYLEMVKL